MKTLNKFSLGIVVIMSLVGAGCTKTLDSSLQPQNSNLPTVPFEASSEENLFESIGWKRVTDPYLGISIGYPTNIYDADLASGINGDKTMILTRRNSNGKISINIWKLSDSPKRPDPRVDFPPGYEETIIAGQTYSIYMSSDGSADRLDEMRAIIDTLR